jgi:hypothetical protein
MINETTSQTQSEVLSQAQPEQTLIIQSPSQAEPLSIKPSIAEIEHFIQFLNNRFSLNIKNDLIVLIQRTQPRTKGYFSPSSWNCEQPENLAFKQQESQAKPSINEITLNSIHLKSTPYETIAHELAHYLTIIDGEIINNRNYHTKRFKARAEQLFLIVNKGKYGFNETSESQAFKELLQEFKPSENAFKIFQNERGKQKAKTRLLKFSCGCGCIIRTARNELKPLLARCLYCNTEFKQAESESNNDGDEDL